MRTYRKTIGGTKYFTSGTEHTFIDCERCGRPYKKSEDYPDGLCPVCVLEDTKDFAEDEE